MVRRTHHLQRTSGICRRPFTTSVSQSSKPVERNRLQVGGNIINYVTPDKHRKYYGTVTSSHPCAVYIAASSTFHGEFSTQYIVGLVKQLLASTSLMPYLQVQILPVQYSLMYAAVRASPSTLANALVAFTTTFTASQLCWAPSATGSSLS